MTSYMRQENIDSTDTLGPQTDAVGHYAVSGYKVGPDHSHYHFAVEGPWAPGMDGRVVQVRPIGKDTPGSLGSHVWHENHGRIGVGLCAMGPGVAPYPITTAQEVSMGRTFAELQGIFGIPDDHVVDHVFFAIKDGYGPGSGDPETRIDFTGSEAGKESWARIMAHRAEFRRQLVAGAIANSLEGVIN